MAEVGLDTRPRSSVHATHVCADGGVCLDTEVFAQTRLPSWLAATLLARSSPGKVSLAQNACDQRVRRTEGLPVHTSPF